MNMAASQDTAAAADPRLSIPDTDSAKPTAKDLSATMENEPEAQQAPSSPVQITEERKQPSDEPKASEEAEPSEEAEQASEETEKAKDDDSDGPDGSDTPGNADDANGVADTAPPPLPDEPLPNVQEDDGWDPMWSVEHNAWFFHNRLTQQTQWENPRITPGATATATATVTATATGMESISGYNPAIHGDYDPEAWYAKGGDDPAEEAARVAQHEAALAAAAALANGEETNKEARFSHDAKARRQMNAFFDVDAAASAHDGRSLRAERSGKKPSRSELKAFKEKRRARKEEKRRAWLRD